MALQVDERLLTAQYYLIEQRKAIREQKIKLYERFRAYALNKLKTQGQPFEVKFRSINGDPKIKYKELNIGDDFFLQYGSFMFDPRTNMMTDYIRYELKGIKIVEDVNKLMTKTNGGLHQERLPQQTTDLATDLEITKINEKMQQKADQILKGIFKGDLRFSDKEFKELVQMNIELEKTLQELDTRLRAVSIVNGSSQIDKNDDKSVEQPSSRPNIVDFLKGYAGSFADATDPCLAMAVLSQQDDIKTM